MELFKSHVNSEGCCYCNGPANACYPVWAIVLLSTAAAAFLALLIFQAFYIGKRFGYEAVPPPCQALMEPCFKPRGSSVADERKKAEGERTSLQG